MAKWIAAIVLSALVLVLAGAGGVLAVLWHYGRSLPDYQQLAGYEPPTVTRVHAGDGRLLAEFAREKRMFVPVEAMPKRVLKAFIAAEDKHFYSHPGIDVTGVARAVITNLKQIGSSHRPVGASTITQQVAKNFLLTNEVSLERKIKEAILAFRIERALTKDRILELYLNEIYLGYGSYGVAAAALNYFNKAMDDLTVSELAFIAGLPKAPNNYHPRRNPGAAIGRRDYVIGRMLDDGYLTPEQAAEARAAPLEIRDRDETEFVDAGHFTEEARRELMRRFGERGVYGGGLSVRTTLDARLQTLADEALRSGLIAYDRRHGWRGPVARTGDPGAWDRELAAVEMPKGVAEARPGWRLAAVLEVSQDKAVIGLATGQVGHIPLAELKWAREAREGGQLGPAVRVPADVLTPGDVVLVAPLDAGGKSDPAVDGAYSLQQVPEIGGGLVALDPHTGRVLAMAGGFSYAQSEFNRVTQARRQPGSAFKPFVYLAALDHGFTPSSLILDAPFSIEQGPGLARWKPSNYSNRFYGPSPLRFGIEYSRNVMTVRLAQHIGIEKVADYAERFGVVRDMPHLLSMSLGAAETTLLDLTTAYAMLVNGGKRVRPTLVDRVQDRNGRTVFRHESRSCIGCAGVEWRALPPPVVPDDREQVADPRSAYQIVSMLQGVVERGTGRRIREIGKPLAGKTGTTNDSLDAWFVGFSPDLAVGVFVGFDQPRPLGRDETGSSVAVPVFRDFMAAALQGEASVPFRIPPGIRLVRVNHDTGLPARSGDRNVIREAFLPGTEPSDGGGVSSGGGVGMDGDWGAPGRATRGVY